MNQIQYISCIKGEIRNLESNEFVGNLWLS